MNQSTVPHEEIGIRLSICNEFLSNEKKPIHEAYASLMNKIGRKIMEYTEFEYWFKRFQNNQFDLGYDTSLDSKEISEIQNTIVLETNGVQDAPPMVSEKEDPVKAMERKMEDIKLKYQFNEKDVPKVFQDLMKDYMNGLAVIQLIVSDEYCTLSLDEMEMALEKNRNDWLIVYNNINKTMKSDDPEKSIIDHLWFVLKNPDIWLSSFRIQAFINPEFESVPKIDFEKLNTLLLSMIDSIDHQFQIESLRCEAFNFNIFLSMLKNMKPGTLKEIYFGNVKNEEGNCQKMKEIIEMDQWKQAEKICSSQVIPSLKIEDLLHCEVFMFAFEKITPEDVVRVKELIINSTNSEICILLSENENWDIDAFRKVLLPNSLKEERSNNGVNFTYKLPNSPNHLSVTLNKSDIRFEKIPKLF